MHLQPCLNLSKATSELQTREAATKSKQRSGAPATLCLQRARNKHPNLHSLFQQMGLCEEIHLRVYMEQEGGTDTLMRVQASVRRDKEGRLRTFEDSLQLSLQQIKRVLRANMYTHTQKNLAMSLAANTAAMASRAMSPVLAAEASLRQAALQQASQTQILEGHCTCWFFDSFMNLNASFKPLIG